MNGANTTPTKNPMNTAYTSQTSYTMNFANITHTTNTIYTTYAIHTAHIIKPDSFWQKHRISLSSSQKYKFQMKFLLPHSGCHIFKFWRIPGAKTLDFGIPWRPAVAKTAPKTT